MSTIKQEEHGEDSLNDDLVDQLKIHVHSANGNSNASVFASATEADVEDQEVPSTIDKFRKFAWHLDFPKRPADSVVGYCTMYMARNQRMIEPVEKQAVFNILKSLKSLDPISSSVMKELRVQELLRSILGETPRPSKPYEYPGPLQRNAFILFEQIEARLAEEEAIAKSPEPDGASSPRKRRRTSRSESTDVPSSLPTTDPTFRNTMRGVIITTSPRRTYQLDPKMDPPKRRFDIFGHNGLTVGQWWPLRVCALRDGAHGHIQGGISGNATDGAYSIVVSGKSPLPSLTSRTFYPSSHYL